MPDSNSYSLREADFQSASPTGFAKEALPTYLPFAGFPAGGAPFCDGAAAVSFGLSFFGFLASFGPLPIVGFSIFEGCSTTVSEIARVMVT